MLRTTTEGMSAAIGYTDSLTILPFDIAFKTPDDFSNRIAGNQQLIFKEESYLDKTEDPSAGSYYVENLTDSIANNAWDLFLKVEESGGIIEAVKSGFIQDEVEKNFRLKQEELAQRKRILIGTNQFPELHEMMLERVEVKQGSAISSGSLYKRLVPIRISSSFEALRLATEAYVQQGNRRPVVFLFTFGNLAMQRARAGFAANFFGCAGYEIFDNPCFENIDEGLSAVREKQPEIVVLCSSDEEYTDLVPKVIPALRPAFPGLIIVVAGYPKDQTEAYIKLGVDEFIHVRSNLLGCLTKFNRQIGILPK
jgi:methylmalonyl-CoA mutase